MLTLIAAAALAAAQPAVPANPQGQMPMQGHQMPMQGQMPMQMGEAGDHKSMDCCKDCGKDMAPKQAEHKDHPAQ